MVREVFLFLLIVVPAIFAVSVSVGDEGVVQMECGSNETKIIEQLASYGSSITLNVVKTVCEAYECLCDPSDMEEDNVDPNGEEPLELALERIQRIANDQESQISDQTSEVGRFKRSGCFCNTHGCACDLPDNSGHNYYHATHSSSSSSFSSSSQSSSSSITYSG